MDDIKLIVVPVLIVIAVVAALMLPINYFSHKQCANNVTEMGRDYRYDVVNGCRIQMDDGTYIFWKMYRDFERN